MYTIINNNYLWIQLLLYINIIYTFVNNNLKPFDIKNQKLTAESSFHSCESKYQRVKNDILSNIKSLEENKVNRYIL